MGVFFEKAIGMVAQQTIDRDTRRKSAESPDLKEVREDEPAMPIAPLPRGGYTTIAYVALGMLTIQNCGAVLLMRYTRTIDSERQYLTTTAVVLGEIFKLVISGMLVVSQEGTLTKMFADPWEVTKSSVPALLYLLQNNLQYVAVSNLQPATYQVTYQLKILSTAVLSVIMLRKKLSRDQWMALFILTMGVVTVQLSEYFASSATGAVKESETLNLTLGLTCTLIATLSSGLAGVYFEYVIKGGDGVAKLSVWERNFQLAGFSVLIGLGGLLVHPTDYAVVSTKGFFHGYTSLTFFNVFIQSCGGIIIAFVIKHADNILKNFATAFSLVFSCLFSFLLFNMSVSGLFMLGVVMVLFATSLYSQGSAAIIKAFESLTGYGKNQAQHLRTSSFEEEVLLESKEEV